MGAAAQVHRIAFDQAMPWLLGLHTPAEDRWFYRERVFPTCRVWGRFNDDELTGIIAFQDGWIEQLYVLPAAQGRGIGTELLDVAKAACDRLELWTFQRNTPARRFYEARGFTLVEQTDGARNEEREPDARYVWTR
ncbi:GNAT family N-acetyltransferase [Bradyrhizobium japonicum]|nr:GNAT family N-acetyltransferase [Bradyrhizobium japonicum]MBR0729957.1 GNAT family N-acetyltransferase [Bradyrhizobium japonicum]MBR0764084.1 GNAT family N-acetyltransferase [Bradyrhizobium japonicum]MBR0802010.1 GNAT family N-acetyltransferase [Bradyrhizobium japonicum]MYV82954.1 GNAT family N-acetyltransferase [Bradyrhizobium japonicum]